VSSLYQMNTGGVADLADLAATIARDSRDTNASLLTMATAGGLSAGFQAAAQLTTIADLADPLSRLLELKQLELIGAVSVGPAVARLMADLDEQLTNRTLMGADPTLEHLLRDLWDGVADGDVSMLAGLATDAGLFLADARRRLAQREADIELLSGWTDLPAMQQLDRWNALSSDDQARLLATLPGILATLNGLPSRVLEAAHLRQRELDAENVVLTRRTLSLSASVDLKLGSVGIDLAGSLIEYADGSVETVFDMSADLAVALFRALGIAGEGGLSIPMRFASQDELDQFIDALYGAALDIGSDAVDSLTSFDFIDDLLDGDVPIVGDALSEIAALFTQHPGLGAATFAAQLGLTAGLDIAEAALELGVFVGGTLDTDGYASIFLEATGEFDFEALGLSADAALRVSAFGENLSDGDIDELVLELSASGAAELDRLGLLLGVDLTAIGGEANAQIRLDIDDPRVRDIADELGDAVTSGQLGSVVVGITDALAATTWDISVSTTTSINLIDLSTLGNGVELTDSLSETVLVVRKNPFEAPIVYVDSDLDDLRG
jgi:hypothetical protein